MNRAASSSAGEPLRTASADGGPSHAKGQRDSPRRSFLLQASVLVGLGAVLFFLGLGYIALLDPDEPYYAVPALEMMRSGTWLVPLLHGRPWFDKPIFYYWTILGTYKVLGVSEAATRLSSAAAGLAGILVLFAWTRRSGGLSSGARALAPAVILATSLEYALLARAAVTDMTLTLFLTFGMLAMARYLETNRLLWTTMGGMAFGLAVLTKGPAGLILPAAALLAYAVLARRRCLLQVTVLASTTAGILLAAGPWYAYMAVAHRDLLVQTFLGSGNLGRFLNPEHQSFPLFYVLVLFVGMLPWSSALPAALVAAGRPSAWSQERASSTTVGAGPSHSRRIGPLYALCWFGSVVLVFSVSASKLSTYILPAFPPAALMLGDFWSSVLAPSFHEGIALDPRSVSPARSPLPLPLGARISCALGIGLSVALAAAALLTPHSEWGVTSATAAVVSGLVLSGAIAFLLAIRRRSLTVLLASQAAMVIALLLIVVFVVGPRVETLRSTRPLIRELRARGLETQVVGAYRERDFSQDFYLRRTLPRESSLRGLERAVQLHPGGLWLVPSSNVAEINANSALQVETVALHPKSAALRLHPSNLRSSETHGPSGKPDPP